MSTIALPYKAIVKAGTTGNLSLKYNRIPYTGNTESNPNANSLYKTIEDLKTVMPNSFMIEKFPTKNYIKDEIAAWNKLRPGSDKYSVMSFDLLKGTFTKDQEVEVIGFDRSKAQVYIEDEHLFKIVNIDPINLTPINSVSSKKPTVIGGRKTKKRSLRKKSKSRRRK